MPSTMDFLCCIHLRPCTGATNRHQGQFPPRYLETDLLGGWYRRATAVRDNHSHVQDDRVETVHIISDMYTYIYVYMYVELAMSVFVSFIHVSSFVCMLHVYIYIYTY